MKIHEYFADVADELNRKSARVRRDFATHRPSGGENRESVVGSFLKENLPMHFGVDTGLILAQSGEFTRQADLCIVDQTWNAPLYLTSPNRIWPIEAVYALIEVKTRLSPSNLSDAIEKCRRFKTLPRQFDDAPATPQITDSLFVLWAFEGPSAATVKRNINKALEKVPRAEQPDYIVIPDSVVATAGSYRELARAGQPGSTYREQILRESGGDIEGVIGEPIEVLELGQHALLVFFLWLTSWLKRAGQRSAPLMAYLPTDDRKYGRVVD
jgi:hypothetical protein